MRSHEPQLLRELTPAYILCAGAFREAVQELIDGEEYHEQSCPIIGKLASEHYPELFEKVRDVSTPTSLPRGEGIPRGEGLPWVSCWHLPLSFKQEFIFEQVTKYIDEQEEAVQITNYISMSSTFVDDLAHVVAYQRIHAANNFGTCASVYAANNFGDKPKSKKEVDQEVRLASVELVPEIRKDWLHFYAKRLDHLLAMLDGVDLVDTAFVELAPAILEAIEILREKQSTYAEYSCIQLASIVAKNRNKAWITVSSLLIDRMPEKWVEQFAANYTKDAEFLERICEEAYFVSEITRHIARENPSEADKPHKEHERELRKEWVDFLEVKLMYLLKARKVFDRREA